MSIPSRLLCQSSNLPVTAATRAAAAPFVRIPTELEDFFLPDGQELFPTCTGFLKAFKAQQEHPSPWTAVPN